MNRPCRRLHKPMLLLLGAVLAIAGPAGAQTYSIWDVGKRTQMSLNTGGMAFFEEETGAESWRGVSLGGALTYSLHRVFAVHATYDHGFPVDAVRNHQDLFSGFANLRILPKPGEASDTHLFVGGGALRIESDVVDWRYEGHFVVNHQFKDGWGAFFKFTHARSVDDGVAPLNMVKFGGQAKLFGWKPKA